MKGDRLCIWFLVILLGVSVRAMTYAAEAPAGDEKKPARDERQKLTPEERQVRAKELREKMEKMTPKEREEQRKVWRERMEKRIQELKEKKARGKITEQEVRQLEQWEQRLKLWDQRDTPYKPEEKPREKK
jgi:predicted HTH transcriptional regulator